MVRLIDLLKEINSNKPVYSFNFIETIAVWMNFGVQNKQNLKKLLKLNIPQKFKIVKSPIYRVIAVDEYSDIYPGIGSWTLDINIAKDFTNELWFQDNYKAKAILLKIDKPKPENVILNIDAIFNDPEFLNSIEQHEDSGVWFNEGLELKNIQREVIYNATELNEKNIVAELIKGKWKTIKAPLSN